MDLNKTYQCKICSWKGNRTHMHHIIPKKDYGEDCEENLIELCPNCHAEASEDEQAFAEKYNLTGVEYSKDKIKAIEDVAMIVMRNIQGKDEDVKNLYLKYNFDWIDCMAYVLGVTRDSVVKTYLKDKQDMTMYKGATK